MSKYLDSDGLLYVWGKIKTQLGTKVDKETGKGLSTNDYTTTEKNKLSGIEAQANKTTVDSALSSSSTNPVQNKVINTALGNKVDKVSGKGLSTNDYTTTEKNKLAGIEANANNYVLPYASWDTLGGVIIGDNLTLNTSTHKLSGIMSVEDKNKLNGIEAEANKYVHPSYTNKSSGLYKVTVDSTGHVSAATSVAKSDITALGIPAQDTTYSNATTSAAGLMSAADKTKLDGIDVTGIYKYKGSVATVSALPTSASVGDVYNVESDGMNYAWTGTAWDALGGTFSIQSITNAEIDQICT